MEGWGSVVWRWGEGGVWTDGGGVSGRLIRHDFDALFARGDCVCPKCFEREGTNIAPLSPVSSCQQRNASTQTQAGNEVHSTVQSDAR